MSATLLKYIPEDALPTVRKWFKTYSFHLRISKSRVSKYGDFRPASRGKADRISVNGDLNQYHFLITLCHEVAHVACWQRYQNKVNPHGKEWKSIYTELLSDLLQHIRLPESLQSAVQQHMQQPKASSCSDPQLLRALKKFDPENNKVFLEEIPIHSTFHFRGGRFFTKGAKRRSRFECIELGTNRKYLINGNAEVELSEED